MTILRNIIITLLLLTLAAISAVGIMVEAPQVWHWTPDRINAIGRSVLMVMRPGLLLFLVWVVILLATMLVFFISVARPRRRMKIEVQMGGGRVVIMDAAIKKYIRSALSEMGDVTVRKIELRENRKLVTTDITADVRTSENLPILERRIISRVRGALAEDLGITNLGDVHVFIRNFEMSGRALTPSTVEEMPPMPERSEPHEAVLPPINETLTLQPEPEPEPPISIQPFTEKQQVTETPALAEEPQIIEPVIIEDSPVPAERFANLSFADLTKDSAAAAVVPNAMAADEATEPVVPKSVDGTNIHGLNQDMDEHLPWGSSAAESDYDSKRDKDPGAL